MNIPPEVQAILEQLYGAVLANVRANLDTVLGGGDAPSVRRYPLAITKGAKKKPAAAKRAKGAKRTPEELEALTKSILGAIKKAPGSRVEELAATLGIPTSEMALPMLKLREDRLITKKGEKRAARYTAKGASPKG